MPRFKNTDRHRVPVALSDGRVLAQDEIATIKDLQPEDQLHVDGGRLTAVAEPPAAAQPDADPEPEKAPAKTTRRKTATDKSQENT